MMSQKINKRFFILWGFIVVSVLGFCSVIAHAQMSHQEMLQKADEARGNYDGIQWKVSMDSIENGRKQVRQMQVTARGYDALVETVAPSNVKGERFLMKDRNMWFAKPGLSKPVPISPRQKLMGTAANGDIATTNYSGDYKILSVENGKLNNEACLIMDLQAINNRTTYDRIRYWISKERVVGLKAEFYTVSGKMFKSAEFEYKNSLTIDESPREFISKMVITSALIKDDVTTLKYSKPLLKKVPDATFNVNLLTK